MFRYSVKMVTTGFIPKIDREEMKKFDNRVAVIIPKQEKMRLCVIDKKSKEAIDIFASENHYPILGEEEMGCIVTGDSIDENKEYVLKMKNTPYSYRDRKRIIKQLKNRKII